jgi:DNA polymerase I-like protein with 3'-5' exonuclease and polymerase domains
MYFMLYPEIRDIFWHEVRTELRQTRILNTPFGRKRMFFGRWDEKFLNEAYAYIPQSTIGDQACAAMINLWDNDKKVWKMPDGAGLLVNGHDSLVGQCWEKDLADVVSIVRSAMRIPLQIHGRELIVPTDVKVGRNWASATEKNPEGMKKWKVA